ncbi:MAG: hypothetical protein ACFNUE_09110, partial [Bacteroides sp.]
GPGRALVGRRWGGEGGMICALGGTDWRSSKGNGVEGITTRRAASFTQDLQQRIALLPIGEIGYYFLVGAAL